jgi:TP901-1 family phage major tail protein
MTVQKGKDLLLKIIDSNGQFVTVAGLRTRRLALSSDTVDATDAESEGRWRELLEGAGVRRASLAGTGLFKDAASDTLIRQYFFDGVIKTWQIIIPSLGFIQGDFQITSLDYRGEHAGELTFDIALESAGIMIFTAQVMS